MWKPFRCRPFREHDYQLRREPGALFLQCSRCGRRSRGWNLTDKRLKRTDTQLRLLMVESGDGLREVCVAEDAGVEAYAMLIDAGAPRLTFAPED